MLESHIEIRNRLCLNTLSCVDDKQCAFACSDGAGDFVGEVHVSWGINQIEYVVLTIELVVHLDGVTFDGDSSFFFEVHIVEHLSGRHFDGLSAFEQSVGQGTLAVVDVGNDAELRMWFMSRVADERLKVSVSALWPAVGTGRAFSVCPLFVGLQGEPPFGMGFAKLHGVGHDAAVFRFVAQVAGL